MIFLKIKCQKAPVHWCNILRHFSKFTMQKTIKLPFYLGQFFYKKCKIIILMLQCQSYIKNYSKSHIPFNFFYLINNNTACLTIDATNML